MLIKRSPYPMIEIGYYSDSGQYVVKSRPPLSFYQGDDISIYIYIIKDDEEKYNLENSQIVFTLFKTMWRDENVASIKVADIENADEGLAIVTFRHYETMNFRIGNHYYIVRLNKDEKSITLAEGILEIK